MSPRHCRPACSRRWAAIALALAPALAAAHAPASEGADGWDHLVAALIVLAGVAYAVGAHRLATRRAWRPGRLGVDGIWFAGGLYALTATLLGPLDEWTSRSFGAHMLQHELLMLVAAPLLVLGRPLARFAWLLPRRWRVGSHRWLATVRTLTGWRLLTSTGGSCAVQTVALFAWHVPAWFRAAVESPFVHMLQHVTFLATALAFWWGVLRPGIRRGHLFAALASLFVPTLSTGALGANLPFSSRAWYVVPGMAPPWGLSLLEDQQLGGLLMWVPGGTVYLAVALLLLARALRSRDALPAALHAARPLQAP